MKLQVWQMCAIKQYVMREPRGIRESFFEEVAFDPRYEILNKGERVRWRDPCFQHF